MAYPPPTSQNASNAERQTTFVSRDTRHGPLTIGYVEAKDIGVPLREAERSEQLRRYLASLDNLILTNYLEFRWYLKGKRQLKRAWRACRMVAS
jgi:hypothetical protein